MKVPFRNPTPTTDNLIETTWPEYDAIEEAYIDIGYDLKIKQHHNQERLKVWHEFQERFTGHI